MDQLSRLAGRPYAFIFRYVRRRALSHTAIVAAVLAAVACSITTQYGVKYLVDALAGSDQSRAVWFAFTLLVSLIAADNILWRLAGWIASFSFVCVTGDLRRDLFRHLTGHSRFAETGTISQSLIDVLARELIVSMDIGTHSGNATREYRSQVSGSGDRTKWRTRRASTPPIDTGRFAYNVGGSTKPLGRWLSRAHARRMAH